MRKPMPFAEFSERFGGSFRRKHVNSPLEPKSAKTLANKRSYALDTNSEIPLEFIRLEPWEGELLFMVAARARVRILETGRYNGGSVFVMACANPSVPIHSIDLQPRNDDLLREIFERADVGGNVDLIVGDSQNTRYPQVGPIDLLFVDGDHSYEGCTRDLRNWYDLVVPGGHVLLHDCYHGNQVMDAVIDFVRDRDVMLLTSPYIVSGHWNSPTGSMMHFIKRGPMPQPQWGR